MRRAVLSALAVVCLLALPLAAQAQATFTSLAVGSTSTAQSVTVTATAGGVVNTVNVLTAGASGLDFAAAAGNSTCAGTTLAVTQSCTQMVSFSPQAPGIRTGAVVLLAANGSVLGIAYLSGTGVGGLGVLSPGLLEPVAGQYALYTGIGDGSLATTAELYLPTAVAVDGAGNLFIADSLHHRLRMVCSPAPPVFVTNCTGVGIMVTVAGDGNPAYSGDGGPAAQATLDTPNGVAVDGAGNIYIADTGNNAIRVISTNSGVISTFAGNGRGTPGYGGDGGAPTANAVLFNLPSGVSVDPAGNVYIADTGNHRIRRVLQGAAPTITTVAGDGYTASNGDGGYNGETQNGSPMPATSAELNYPHAVAFDAAGNMYIPDAGNNRVRKVTAVGGAITNASTIATFAGTGVTGRPTCSTMPTPATATPLSSPSGVAVDAAGNVYIADTQNAAIREVNQASGQVLNLAINNCLSPYLNGNADPFSGDLMVGVYGPIGIALDGKGNLFFADSLNMVVAEIEGNQQSINYASVPVRQGSQSAAVTQPVENHGNAPLELSALTAGTNTALGSNTSCVAGAANLAPGAQCSIAAVFAPQAAGNPLTGNISMVDDAQPGPPEVVNQNSPLVIQLAGNATAVNSTTTVVASQPNPSVYGQAVTFTVTVTTGAGTGNLTGTVGLVDTYNGTASTLATALPVTVNGAGTTGVATYTLSTLGVGVHHVVASYSGDSGHFASASTDNNVAPEQHTVNEATITTLNSSANPAQLGASVTFTAQVSMGGAGGGVTPDGAVTFSWGANAQSVALDVNGKATYTTSALPNGVTTVTAAYGGDSNKQILASQATLNQDVQVSDSIGVVSNLNPSVYGNPVTLTAAISSTAVQPPSGAVKFLDNGTVIGTGTLSGNPAIATYTSSSLTVGSHPITVSYAGDAYNTAVNSTITLTQTVSQTQTAITVAALPSPGIAGAAVALTATVQVVTGSSTVSGQVTFTNGTTTLGTATLSAGKATISLTLPAGSYPIVATYAGDANDQGSASAAYVLTVLQATTQTAVTASPNPAVVTQPVTFTAKVTGNGGTPTGTVTFLNGSAALGVATLASGAATLTTSSLSAGTYSITATYAGDANDMPSSAPAYSLTVSTISTTTTLGSASTGGTNAQTLLVASVVDNTTGPVPTGTVTFTNGGATLGSATINGSGIATFLPNLAAGTNYSIVATYAGDPSHAGSASQPLAVTGIVSNFGITLNPSSISMQTKQNRTIAVTFASSSGYADTLNLGCAALPVGMTCHFAPASVSLLANGTVSSQLTIDTNNPLSGGASAMNTLPGHARTALAGWLLPGGILLGLALGRRRRLGRTFWTLLLVLALSAGMLTATGCGNGISLSSVAPGTYTIEVTGTGVNSNVIHYQTLTVTVTQ